MKTIQLHFIKWKTIKRPEDDSCGETVVLLFKIRIYVLANDLGKLSKTSVIFMFRQQFIFFYSCPNHSLSLVNTRNMTHRNRNSTNFFYMVYMYDFHRKRNLPGISLISERYSH
jgi:hypothetical protein